MSLTNLGFCADLRSLDLKTGSFSLRQIKAATENFNIENKMEKEDLGQYIRYIDLFIMTANPILIVFKLLKSCIKKCACRVY